MKFSASQDTKRKTRNIIYLQNGIHAIGQTLKTSSLMENIEE